MEGNPCAPHLSSPHGATYGPVYASGHSLIHQGDTYIGQDPTRNEFESFRQSLNFPDLSLREESIKAAFDGTFEWIFQTKADQLESHSSKTTSPDQRYVAADGFKAWLCHSPLDSRFWIRGKAGSGKSTFMSFINSHNSLSTLLQSPDPSQKHVVLRHYFWHLGTPLQRNLTGFLRSMIWQFFATEPDQGFKIWYDHLRSRRILIWTIQNLTYVLRTILDHSTCSFYFFIDGLDECIDSDDLLSLLHNLESLQHLKVCISSRPERKYELAFKKWSTLQLDQLTYSDMRLYAEKRLQSLFQTSSQVTSSILYFKDLLRNLIQRAEGVFVWLCIVVQSLREGFENLDDSSTLIERVNEYPEDIHQLYLFILERHKGNLKRYKASGAAVFRLLLRNQNQTPDRSLRLYLPYGQDRESGSLALCRLAWARNDMLRKEFFRSDLTVQSIERMWKELQLEALCAQLPVHCGNFIEIVDRPLQILQRRAKLKAKANRTDLANMLFGNQYVQFIHKTVADFLVDQESGRALLSFDSTVDGHLESSFRDADFVIAITYMTLIREAQDKSCRVLIAASGDPSNSYSKWSLLESIVEKAFSDRSLPKCCHCLLEQNPATAVPPSWDNGFLFYCVLVGRLDYLCLTINDPKRLISRRDLTNILSMIVMLYVDRKDMPGGLTDLDLVKEILETLLKHGANPNAPIFSPHILRDGQVCPATSNTLSSFVKKVSFYEPIRKVTLDLLRSYTKEERTSEISTSQLWPYKIAMLHRFQKNPSEESINQISHKSSYEPRPTSSHNQGSAHDVGFDMNTSRYLLESSGAEIHWPSPESRSMPEFMRSADLRLAIWHPEQDTWLLLAPEVSKRLLQAHNFTQEEIILGLSLSRLRPLLFSTFLADPGLIWLTWVNDSPDVIEITSILRCAFRQAIHLPTLAAVFLHLEWPQVDVDFFFRYCSDYRERCSVDMFVDLTAEALSTAVIHDDRPLCILERDWKLYLSSCVQFVRMSNSQSLTQYAQNDWDLSPAGMERLNSEWRLTKKAELLTLGDYLLRFIFPNPGSSHRFEPVTKDVIACSVNSENAFFTCSQCSLEAIPCFGVPSAAKDNGCMMCFFKRRQCSFDTTDARALRLTAFKDPSNRVPMIVQNMVSSPYTQAGTTSCWFEGMCIATVTCIIKSRTLPVGIWDNFSRLFTSGDLGTRHMYIIISITDRLSQILHALGAFEAHLTPTHALLRLSSVISKLEPLETEGVLIPDSLQLLTKMSEFLDVSQTATQRRKDLAFEIVRHKKFILTTSHLCKTFVFFNNGLCTYLPHHHSDSKVSAGDILVVVDRDDTHDSVLLSRMGTSNSYTILRPMVVPQIKNHVPDWKKADTRLFKIVVDY